MQEYLASWTLALAVFTAGCVEPSGDSSDDAGVDREDAGESATDGGAADAGGDPPGPPCEGPPGLYQDDACELVAEGVVSYTPRFPLWTDGVRKERFIALPYGARIDASDPDRWIFPVGTRLWKNFIVEGKRVETRELVKVRDGDGIAAWEYAAYAWDEAGRSATPIPQGVIDTLGTNHDIPSSSDCEQCHAPAAADMVLGFSAIQLNHPDSELRLDDLNDDGWFVEGQSVSTSEADVPGDATAQAALGYLYGNCAHCHVDGLVPAPAGLEMHLYVGDTTVEGTEAYRTAVNTLGEWLAPGSPPAAVDRIEPGLPEESSIWLRVSNGEMPPLGIETVDPHGLAALGAWITALAD